MYKDPVVQKQWQTSWYQRNKERLNQKQNERRSAFRARLWAYKATLCCSRCGEGDPACLDFHHPEGTKEFHISDAVLKNISFEKALEEIKKCEVLCANCHRKEHRNQDMR